MDDIAPYLLEEIQKEFDSLYRKNKKIQKLLEIINSGRGTYEEANEYAIEVGEILAKCYADSITEEILPDGKMYYNIAKRLIEPTMQNNFDLISDVATEVQSTLNRAAAIGLKVAEPEMNFFKTESIINKLTSDQFSKVAFILQEPIVHFSQSIVDDTIKENAELHSKSGLHPKITRKVRGGCCKWCMNLAGTYEYPDDVPDDVYRRHDHCRCEVLYDPGEGKQVQNVHTKSWENKKQDIEKRISFSNGTQLENCKSVMLDWMKKFDKDNIGVELGKYYENNGRKYLVDGVNVVQDHSKRELEVANIISNKFGKKVVLVPRVNNPEGISTPDYLIGGDRFDSKEIRGSGKNTIDSAIKNKKEQSENFILDITKYSDLSMEDIYSQIDRMYKSNYRKWIDKIMIIKGDKVIELLKRK